jgi:hypothetical protein
VRVVLVAAEDLHRREVVGATLAVEPGVKVLITKCGQ